MGGKCSRKEREQVQRSQIRKHWEGCTNRAALSRRRVSGEMSGGESREQGPGQTVPLGGF